MPRPATLVDAFPYFNEIMLLQARLAYLGNLQVPIIHIAGEGNYTHSGIPRNYSLRELIVEQKLKLNEGQTFIVLEIDLANYGSPWEREIGTRERILEEVKKRFHPCKIILSDLDEIPSLSQVKKFMEMPHGSEFSFPIKNYYRRVNWRPGQDISPNNGLFLDSSGKSRPNGGRYGGLPQIESNGSIGKHFSYLHIDLVSYQEKSTAIAESHLFANELFRSNRFIEFCDLYRINHLGRLTRKGFGLLKVERKLDDMQDFVARFFPKWLDTSRSPLFYLSLVGGCKDFCYSEWSSVFSVSEKP
jgi:hypothetical protein